MLLNSKLSCLFTPSSPKIVWKGKDYFHIFFLLAKSSMQMCRDVVVIVQVSLFLYLVAILFYSMFAVSWSRYGVEICILSLHKIFEHGVLWFTNEQSV